VFGKELVLMDSKFYYTISYMFLVFALFFCWVSSLAWLPEQPGLHSSALYLWALVVESGFIFLWVLWSVESHGERVKDFMPLKRLAISAAFFASCIVTGPLGLELENGMSLLLFTFFLAFPSFGLIFAWPIYKAKAFRGRPMFTIIPNSTGHYLWFTASLGLAALLPFLASGNWVMVERLSGLLLLACFLSFLVKPKDLEKFHGMK
jgi:hypothetical protein